MNYEEFQNLNIKKGTFVNVTYQSIKKPLKAHKDAIIMKITNGTYRVGLRYSKMRINEGKEINPLKGGEWVEGYENILLASTQGGYNVRLYNTFNPRHKSHTKWLLNGVEVTKEYLLENGYFNEHKSQGPIPTFTIKLENLIKIGK